MRGSKVALPAQQLVELCGCFKVYKDQDRDRFIINPTVWNSRTRSLKGDTRLLGQGFSLARLSIPKGAHLRISARDLREFYSSFVVSRARALRNSFNAVFPSAAFSDLNCYDPALSGCHVVPCLNTLAQGDAYAVEIAQSAHLSVLRREAGACRAEHMTVHREPFPRSHFCLLYTSPSPRDQRGSRMPSSA